MKPAANTALAKYIATELLKVDTPTGPKECTRLQLMLKMPDGHEANMGGRCKQSAIEVIERCTDFWFGETLARWNAKRKAERKAAKLSRK